MAVEDNKAFRLGFKKKNLSDLAKGAKCVIKSLRSEYVSSAGSMNCSQFNVNFMSRKGARFGGGSSSSGFPVRVNSLAFSKECF